MSTGSLERGPEHQQHIIHAAMYSLALAAARRSFGWQVGPTWSVVYAGSGGGGFRSSGKFRGVLGRISKGVIINIDART